MLLGHDIKLAILFCTYTDGCRRTISQDGVNPFTIDDVAARKDGLARCLDLLLLALRVLPTSLLTLLHVMYCSELVDLAFLDEAARTKAGTEGLDADKQYSKSN